MKNIFLIAISFLFFVSAAHATIYYMDSNSVICDNEGVGTAVTTPWCNLFALEKSGRVLVGDDNVLFRPGDYNGTEDPDTVHTDTNKYQVDIDVNGTGTSGHPITFKPNPAFDGNVNLYFATGSTSQTVFGMQFGQRSVPTTGNYIVWNGDNKMNFIGHVIADSNTFPATGQFKRLYIPGIFDFNFCTGCELRNLTVTGVQGMDEVKFDSAGVYTLTGDAIRFRLGSTQLIVDNIQLTCIDDVNRIGVDSQTNGDGVTCTAGTQFGNRSCTFMSITNSDFKMCSHSSITLDETDDVNITGNNFNPVFRHAIGFGNDSSRFIIAYNNFFNWSYIPSEDGAAQNLEMQRQVEHVQIHHNLFYEPALVQQNVSSLQQDRRAISIGKGSFNAAVPNPHQDDINIFNNTFDMNGGGDLGIAYLTMDGNTFNNNIINNILYGVFARGAIGYRAGSRATWDANGSGFGNTDHNNLIYDTRGAFTTAFFLPDKNFTVTELDANTWSTGNAYGDPLFIAPPNLQLSNGSPAIDHGLNLGSGYVDYAGTPIPQNGFWDIGAYESSVTCTGLNRPLGKFPSNPSDGLKCQRGGIWYDFNASINSWISQNNYVDLNVTNDFNVGNDTTLNGLLGFGGTQFQFPLTDGIVNTCIITNGSGTLSFGTCGGATNPAGADQSIQINNGGVFGDSNFFKDGNFLGIGTNNPDELIHALTDTQHARLKLETTNAAKAAQVYVSQPDNSWLFGAATNGDFTIQDLNTNNQVFTLKGNTHLPDNFLIGRVTSGENRFGINLFNGSPSYTLDVNGIIRSDSNIIADGNVIVNGNFLCSSTICYRISDLNLLSTGDFVTSVVFNAFYPVADANIVNSGLWMTKALFDANFNRDNNSTAIWLGKINLASDANNSAWLAYTTIADFNRHVEEDVNGLFVKLNPTANQTISGNSFLRMSGNGGINLNANADVNAYDFNGTRFFGIGAGNKFFDANANGVQIRPPSIFNGAVTFDGSNAQISGTQNADLNFEVLTVQDFKGINPDGSTFFDSNTTGTQIDTDTNILGNLTITNDAPIIYFNPTGFLSGTNLFQLTDDGSDSRGISIYGGGASGATRGGAVQIFGNDFALFGLYGRVLISSGDASTAVVRINVRGNNNTEFNDNWTDMNVLGVKLRNPTNLGKFADFNVNTSGDLTINVTGTKTTISDDLTVGDDLTITGNNLTANGVTYQTPGSDGSNGNCLVTNGSGVLAWNPCTAPGGLFGKFYNSTVDSNTYSNSTAWFDVNNSSFTIAANLLDVNKTIKITACGVASSNSALGNETFDINVNLDTVGVIQVPMLVAKSSVLATSGFCFNGIIIVRTTGSSGTVVGNGTAFATAVISGTIQQAQKNSNPSTINTTTSHVLKLVIRQETASTADKMQFQNVYYEAS